MAFGYDNGPWWQKIAINYKRATIECIPYKIIYSSYLLLSSSLQTWMQAPKAGVLQGSLPLPCVFCEF